MVAGAAIALSVKHVVTMAKFVWRLVHAIDLCKLLLILGQVHSFGFFLSFIFVFSVINRSPSPTEDYMQRKTDDARGLLERMTEATE